MAWVVGPAAPAGSTSPGVAAEAWFWKGQAPSSSPVPFPSPDPDGHLPVALVGGDIQKVSLVRLDVDRSSAVSASVTFAAPGDEPTGDANADQAVLRACLVTAAWDAGPAQPFDRLPAVDCTSPVPGAFAGTGPDRKVTFDLTAFLARWSSGTPDFGIAIEPDTAVANGPAPATWQIGLHGAARDGVTVTSNSSAASSSTSDTSAAGAGPATGTSSSSSSSFGSDSSATVPYAFPAPPSDGSAATPAAGPSVAARPVAGGQPASTGGVAASRVLAGIPVNRRVEIGLWWALALFAAASGLVAVVTASTRSQRELRLAGAASMVAMLLTGATWQGAAGQATAWAQVPYLASGGLLALVTGIVAFTLGLAPVLRTVARRRLPS